MSWVTKTLSSSLGRKLIMAVTGLSLIIFLIVHCGINSLIFFNDGGETFNTAAEFMGTNWLIRTTEVGLMLGFIIHIVDGLMLLEFEQSKTPSKIRYSEGRS